MWCKKQSSSLPTSFEYLKEIRKSYCLLRYLELLDLLSNPTESTDQQKFSSKSSVQCLDGWLLPVHIVSKLSPVGQTKQSFVNKLFYLFV